MRNDVDIFFFCIKHGDESKSNEYRYTKALPWKRFDGNQHMFDAL